MTSSLRRILCWSLCLALLLAALPTLAEDYEDVVLAGAVVARLRDPGKFASLADRAAKADQALIEVLSTQDTMHPNVQVKQESGMWTVSSGPIRVLTVLPKDATGAGLAARALADTWAQNLRDLLPKATPPSRMGAAAPRAATPPPAGSTPPVTTPVPPRPAATTLPALPVTTGPAPTTRSAALLLLLDAFNAARGMPEEEYLAQRDKLAGDLLTKLATFLAGQGGAALVLPPAVVETPPTTSTTLPPPVTTSPATEVPPATVPLTTPATTTAVPTLAAVPAPVVPAEWKSLPARDRVTKKFALIQEPYGALKTADSARYTQVGELLRGARTAKAAFKWDEAESYLDGALTLLGATGL